MGGPQTGMRVWAEDRTGGQWTLFLPPQEGVELKHDLSKGLCCRKRLPIARLEQSLAGDTTEERAAMPHPATRGRASGESCFINLDGLHGPKELKALT